MLRALPGTAFAAGTWPIVAIALFDRGSRAREPGQSDEEKWQTDGKCARGTVWRRALGYIGFAEERT